MRAWMIVAVIGLAAGVWLYRAFMHDYGLDGPVRSTNCASNIRQVAEALLLYQEDNGKLPFRDNWMAVEGGLPASLFRCPGLPNEPGLWGYAFNSNLERTDVRKLPNPADIPMVYDSDNMAQNASDPLLSLPKTNRHKDGNHVVYADGHFASVRAR